MTIYRLRRKCVFAVYRVTGNPDRQHERVALYRSLETTLARLLDGQLSDDRMYAVVDGVMVAKSWS